MSHDWQYPIKTVPQHFGERHYCASCGAGAKWHKFSDDGTGRCDHPVKSPYKPRPNCGHVAKSHAFEPAYDGVLSYQDVDAGLQRIEVPNTPPTACTC